ncbi:MAG: hypothetical protein H8K10_03900 [Nitrospira sp.]|nr:hypothetical protein [Nitrospira sp.]
MSLIKSHLLVSMATSATMSRSRCRHRPADRVAGPVRTVVDDSRSLAITAWTCAACGNLIEELHLLSRDGAAQPYPIRHAVAPQAQTRRLAAWSVSS